MGALVTIGDSLREAFMFWETLWDITMPESVTTTTAPGYDADAKLHEAAETIARLVRS